jgi:predicted NBD/HSP70 family sugar kinase
MEKQKKRKAKKPLQLAIGIDIGGSKIAGALLGRNGKMLAKYIRPTEAYKSKEEILENILEVIHMLKREGTGAIGVGAPGMFDRNGTLIFIPNVKHLQNVNLKEEIKKRHNAQIMLANDAKCFAIAENRLGAGRGTKHMIGVVIGTGVGSGIIIDGRIYTGACGGGGEIGHNKLVDKDGFMEIEHLIAGQAILRRYEALSGKKAMSLSQIARSNPHFKKTYREFVNNTGLFFANLVNTLNPEMIVVGGGVSHLDFCKDVERQMRRLAVKRLGESCRIERGKLGDYAGAIGAALLAMENSSQ